MRGWAGPCMCGGCRRCLHDQGLSCGERGCRVCDADDDYQGPDPEVIDGVYREEE